MGRAELRRNKKETLKNKKTFVMTREELDKIRNQAYQKARKELMGKTDELSEQILKMMLVIPTNVLINDYWEKTAEKRIPKFIEDCLSLYKNWTDGAVTMEEMQELTERYGQIKLVEDGTATARVIKENH